MSGPVLTGLFDQTWYNGENLTADQYGYVLFENKILGLPRLRQLRVTNESCTVYKKFQSMIPECFAPYSEGKENRSTCAPAHDNITTTA
jgi:polycystin 2